MTAEHRCLSGIDGAWGCTPWCPDGLRRETVYSENLRVLQHEAETPMRGHDATCCLRARLGATASAALDTLDANPDASAVAAWEQAVTAELVASTLSERTAVPGQLLPPLPVWAYAPDAQPLQPQEPANPARAILNALADALAKPLLWLTRRR